MNRRTLLKVLGAGGCGAAVVVAGRSLFRPPAGRPSLPEPAGSARPFGFFDVDSRELNKAGNALGFRPRVEPLVDRLKRLYALAEQRSAPLVFTTCCSGRVLGPDSLAEVLFVPLDAAQREWAERLGEHRLFCVQKKTYTPDTQLNFSCRAYDMFQDNGNAARLVQALNVGEWIVFGNGFDLCINSAVHGLLAAGQKVCLLSDVWVTASRGYYVSTPRGQMECGTPQNQARILAEFRQLGVRMATLEEFLASVARSPA
jgi:nicotinamidase-related amidase